MCLLLDCIIEMKMSVYRNNRFSNKSQLKKGSVFFIKKHAVKNFGVDTNHKFILHHLAVSAINKSLTYVP